MTEKDLEQQRSRDTALRKAVGRRASIVPPLPEKLNEQLLQTAVRPQRKKWQLLPWMVAACITAILVIFLTPPKSTNKPAVVEKRIVKVRKDTVNKEVKTSRNLVAEIPPVRTVVKHRPKPKEVKTEEALNEPAVDSEQIVTPETELPTPQTTEPQVAHIVREEDLPITNPENLRYTAEEIALLKKQAREAYIKWIKLELEINRQNLEQTAQYIKQMK